MPSFEFVIPESFLFIPANLSFISCCFFMSFILSKIFRSKIVFFVLLTGFLSIAYYDLFVKYAVKNYYSLSQMNEKIYFYPQKDDAGKIESLGMSGIYNHFLQYSTSLSPNEVSELSSLHENYINRFIDITISSNKYNRTISVNQRLYLNNNKEKALIREEPRYVITKDIQEGIFPKMYGQHSYKFVDTKTNQVLATAFNIFFLTSNNKFRNKYLYWNREKEEEFNLPSIQNFDIIYKKLFIDYIK